MGIILNYTNPEKTPQEPDDQRCNHAGARTQEYCSKQPGHTDKHGQYYKWVIEDYTGAMCEKETYHSKGYDRKGNPRKLLVWCPKPKGHTDNHSHWQPDGERTVKKPRQLQPADVKHARPHKDELVKDIYRECCELYGHSQALVEERDYTVCPRCRQPRQLEWITESEQSK